MQRFESFRGTNHIWQPAHLPLRCCDFRKNLLLDDNYIDIILPKMYS
jgi:hypothetical protein